MCLDPKKFPLKGQDYSQLRSKLAQKKGTFPFYPREWGILKIIFYCGVRICRIISDDTVVSSGGDCGLGRILLAVHLDDYPSIDPDEGSLMTRHSVALIDCFGILNDKKIKRYFCLCCDVKGLRRVQVKRFDDGVFIDNRFINALDYIGTGRQSAINTID